MVQYQLQFLSHSADMEPFEHQRNMKERVLIFKRSIKKTAYRTMLFHNYRFPFTVSSSILYKPNSVTIQDRLMKLCDILTKDQNECNIFMDSV